MSVPNFCHDVFLSLAKPSLLALGEIYCKAWQASGGEFRRILENDCIQVKNKSLATVYHCFDTQDILYRTLVAPRSLSAPTLRFLSVFFAKKANSIPLDTTLTRLLEPILWRHLKVLHTN